MKTLTLEEIQEKKDQAKETFAKIQQERDEYKEVIDLMQPLLATLAVALYTEDVTDISLDKLITDSINFINGNANGVIH